MWRKDAKLPPEENVDKFSNNIVSRADLMCQITHQNVDKICLMSFLHLLHYGQQNIERHGQVLVELIYGPENDYYNIWSKFSIVMTCRDEPAKRNDVRIVTVPITNFKAIIQ